MALAAATVQNALRAAGAVGKQIKSWDELAAGANDALSRIPNLTKEGAAAFLASCAQESAYFRTTTEYGTGQRYAPFIGRTFIQLTWQENYAAFGSWAKGKGIIGDAQQFVKNPVSLSDYRWAWLGPVFYFEKNNLWKWANPGLFKAVSQAINGGVGRAGTSFIPNGWKERQQMYAAFLAAGSVLVPGPVQSVSGSAQGLPSLSYGMKNHPAVASLQRFCNLYNWTPDLPILPVTGNYLDQTADVIRRAGMQMGVPANDGKDIGPRYKDAFWARGWRG